MLEKSVAAQRRGKDSWQSLAMYLPFRYLKADAIRYKSFNAVAEEQSVFLERIKTLGIFGENSQPRQAMARCQTLVRK